MRESPFDVVSAPANVKVLVLEHRESVIFEQVHNHDGGGTNLSMASRTLSGSLSSSAAFIFSFTVASVSNTPLSIFAYEARRTENAQHILPLAHR